jgi:uncharacterized membrane protein YhdT
MIKLKHLLKATAAWISIIYVICFTGVAFLPGLRPGFIQYGLHIDMGRNILGTFFSGLIIWNVITLLMVWLFVALFNGIKK